MIDPKEEQAAVSLSVPDSALRGPWARMLLAMFLAVFMQCQLSPPAAAQENPAPAVAQPSANSAPAPESMLRWLVRTSGWIGLIILGLSIYLVASIVSNFFEIRRDAVIPPELVDESMKLIGSRDFAGLYQRMRQDGSFLGSVTAAGLEELRNGVAEARESMDRSADAQVAEMDRRISMIAVIGTLGPMIGLLGTLKGMIGAFSVIARNDVQMRPSEVAGNISEALLLTFEGVALSIPAIYFFAFYRNRITAFTTEAAGVADGLVRRVLEASKSRPPADKGAADPKSGS